MSKILFITSKYLPYPDANGINTSCIINELFKNGDEIFCICSREKKQPIFERINNINVYRVKESFYSKLLAKYKMSPNNLLVKIVFSVCTLIRRIKGLILIPLFPDIAPFRSLVIYNLVKQIHKKHKLDCVIGVFRPFEGVKVAIKMKKKFPEIACGGYYLDLIGGAVIPPYVPRKLYNTICMNAERKTFDALDFVMMAKGGKKIYLNESYREFQDKIYYIDFPLFRDIYSETVKKIDYDKNKVNIVYAGTLDTHYRNPEYFLKVLEKVYEKKDNIVLYLCGTNNCAQIIDEYKIKYPDMIFNYGRVDIETAKAAILSADILLNICNKTDNIVPSKIFELFSTGKPIINVINNREDISLDYFKKYPLTFNIYEWCAQDDISDALIDFIENAGNMGIDRKKLYECFKENTPAPAIKIIKKHIKK